MINSKVIVATLSNVAYILIRNKFDENNSLKIVIMQNKFNVRMKAKT